MSLDNPSNGGPEKSKPLDPVGQALVRFGELQREGKNPNEAYEEAVKDLADADARDFNQYLQEAGLIEDSVRATGEQDDNRPGDESDGTKQPDRLQDVRDKRKSAQQALTARYGNRGQKVEGTQGYAWHDTASDSAYVVRKDGEAQEIRKGEVWNFGQKGAQILKQWEGKDVGWINVSDDSVGDRSPQKPQQTEVPIEKATLASAEGFEGKTTDELKKEVSRLRGEAAAKGIDVSNIFPAADTGSKSKESGMDKFGKPFADLAEQFFARAKNIDEAIQKSDEKLTSVKDIAEKTGSTLAVLQKDIEAIKKAPKPHAAEPAKSPAPEALSKKEAVTTPKLDAWEFSDNPKFNERGERWNAALRARKEGMREGFSEDRQLNMAKYFYEVAEKWKKFPLWGKLGVSLSILGAGVAGSVFSPALAAVSAISAFAWRSISAVGAGALMSTATVTYLKKRNARHPWLWGALAGLGVGAAAFGSGSKYLAEYISSIATPAAVDIPPGTPEVHWTGAAETVVGTGAFPGGDLDAAIDKYMLAPEGPLKDFDLSPGAQAELRDGLKMAILDDNPQLAEAFMGRVPEAVEEAGTDMLDTAVLSGDTLRWSALGDPAHAAVIKDFLTTYGTEHLVPDLESKGGVDGLVARLQEVFAKK